MVKKIKGLTLQFIPYSEISSLSTTERVKKLLQVVLKNKIAILQGRLRPEEESRLIEDTMVLVGSVKGFKGIELAVIGADNGARSVITKMKYGLAKALVGQTDTLTVVGPATVIKEMKKDPKKLEILMRGR